jgi:hypothetical protein
MYPGVRVHDRHRQMPKTNEHTLPKNTNDLMTPETGHPGLRDPENLENLSNIDWSLAIKRACFSNK